jgi:hypothetical protein
MKSLLAGLTAADIRRDPFPHIVSDGPMDRSVYDALSGSFPGFARIGWTCPPDRMPNNRRYEMSAQAILGAPDLPPLWHAVVERHSGRAFLQEVGELFRGSWDPALIAALGADWADLATERLEYNGLGGVRVRQDARIEINTPVRGRPSSPRGAHLDSARRIFSCLFYMRAPEDDSEGGELLLYRWRAGTSRRTDAYELTATEVEVAARIPYAANRLVIFPQSIDALHGVGLRQPTRFIRRYLFLTAELDQDWLQAGPRRGGMAG